MFTPLVSRLLLELEDRGGKPGRGEGERKTVLDDGVVLIIGDATHLLLEERVGRMKAILEVVGLEGVLRCS